MLPFLWPVMTSPWLVLWLGLLSISLFGLMVLVAFLAVDMRRTLQGVQTMIPLWTNVARHAECATAAAEQLVARAHHSVGQVTNVVDAACETAAETLHGIRQLKRHFGTNGARKAPRRRRT